MRKRKEEGEKERGEEKGKEEEEEEEVNKEEEEEELGEEQLSLLRCSLETRMLYYLMFHSTTEDRDIGN